MVDLSPRSQRVVMAPEFTYRMRRRCASPPALLVYIGSALPLPRCCCSQSYYYSSHRQSTWFTSQAFGGMTGCRAAPCLSSCSLLQQPFYAALSSTHGQPRRLHTSSSRHFHDAPQSPTPATCCLRGPSAWSSSARCRRTLSATTSRRESRSTSNNRRGSNSRGVGSVSGAVEHQLSHLLTLPPLHSPESEEDAHKRRKPELMV